LPVKPAPPAPPATPSCAPPAPPSARAGALASAVNNTRPANAVLASNARRCARLRVRAGAIEITLSEIEASSAHG